MADQPDYVKTYDDFWKDIVENPDGTLNRDQLMRELFDYHVVMEQVGQVYCHITNGRISKLNTLANTVIAVADERIEEIVAEALADLPGEAL
ncbi:hypothetical protein [Streptosporangium roseum]|uniref:hypothetical protein n=1 Tax=Streptosporangium roseum TaxID=2001 RepID=UPI0005696C44|nr:hypothetical protein [Streptosporangium roseum]